MRRRTTHQGKMQPIKVCCPYQTIDNSLQYGITNKLASQGMRDGLIPLVISFRNKAEGGVDRVLKSLSPLLYGRFLGV